VDPAITGQPVAQLAHDCICPAHGRSHSRSNCHPCPGLVHGQRLPQMVHVSKDASVAFSNSALAGAVHRRRTVTENPRRGKPSEKSLK